MDKFEQVAVDKLVSYLYGDEYTVRPLVESSAEAQSPAQVAATTHEGTDPMTPSASTSRSAPTPSTSPNTPETPKTPKTRSTSPYTASEPRKGGEQPSRAQGTSIASDKAAEMSQHAQNVLLHIRVNGIAAHFGVSGLVNLANTKVDTILCDHTRNVVRYLVALTIMSIQATYDQALIDMLARAMAVNIGLVVKTGQLDGPNGFVSGFGLQILRDVVTVHEDDVSEAMELLEAERRTCQQERERRHTEAVEHLSQIDRLESKVYDAEAIATRLARAAGRLSLTPSCGSCGFPGVVIDVQDNMNLRCRRCWSYCQTVYGTPP